MENLEEIPFTQRIRAYSYESLLSVSETIDQDKNPERHRLIVDEIAARRAGRYDFHLGHRLGDILHQAGVRVTSTLVCGDAEFSFSGPARAGVLDAWQARIDRMPLLKQICGSDYETVCDSFLRCLGLPEHLSLTKAYSCFGRLEPSA